jgi:hypothetical protein
MLVLSGRAGARGTEKMTKNTETKAITIYGDKDKALDLAAEYFGKDFAAALDQRAERKGCGACDGQNPNGCVYCG